MRTEEQVRAMVERLERINERLAEQLRASRIIEEFDEIAATFNSNGSLLCALHWVLGDDTISILEHE